MKLVITALILPILIFSFAGSWAGIGSSSFHLVVHDAFHGTVSFKGAQISNTVASASSAFAWITLLFAILGNRKSIALVSLAALLVPFLHCAIFVSSFYTAEYRNSLNHVAFLVAVAGMAVVCLASLLTPDD